MKKRLVKKAYNGSICSWNEDGSVRPNSIYPWSQRNTKVIRYLQTHPDTYQEYVLREFPDFYSMFNFKQKK